MKIKSMLIMLFVMITSCIKAENVPLKIKEEFYGLTNSWGKGQSPQEFNEKWQQCFDKLVGYDDRSAVEGEWILFFQRYLLDNAPFEDRWMSESGAEMLLASYAGTTRRSTNCWFVAAEYAKKLTAMEKTARQRFDQLWEAESFDTPETNRILRINAWGNLISIEKALGQTMYATTNVFPRWILPTLPPEEGAALHTNVLRRAGLVQ